MSGNPELVFKTTSPRAIEWYRKISRLRISERKLREEFEDSMTELYGPSQRDTYERNEDGTKKPQTRRLLWLRGDAAYALDSAHNEQPPTDSGWRLDAKDRNWQPKLATKAGKEWKQRLIELNVVNMHTRWGEIGIPAIAFAGSFMYRPGMEFDEDEKVLYVSWGSQWVMREWEKATSKFPDIEWVQVPLSEWHARQEAKKSA